MQYSESPSSVYPLQSETETMQWIHPKNTFISLPHLLQINSPSPRWWNSKKRRFWSSDRDRPQESATSNIFCPRIPPHHPRDQTNRRVHRESVCHWPGHLPSQWPRGLLSLQCHSGDFRVFLCQPCYWWCLLQIVASLLPWWQGYQFYSESILSLICDKC